MNLSCVGKICMVAQWRYVGSFEPLRPCGHSGERADNDWFKVEWLVEVLLEGAEGGC